jgi:hypothetical protein
MQAFLSLTAVAKHFGIKPKVLSDLLWRREIDPDRCPLIGRTRAIPVDYLPDIRRVLVEKGKLPRGAAPE